MLNSIKFLFYNIFACILLQTYILKAQNYGGNYDWRMLGGGPLQVVSFHIGTTTSFNHNAVGYNIGGSFGWNYLSSFYNLLKGIDHVFDVGVRVKYNFSDIGIKSHLIGTEIYLHFPCSTTNIFRHVPQPLSFIVGGGGIFAESNIQNIQIENTKVNGHYIEFGVGILKYFVVNVNLFYRISFFPQNQINLQPLEQSFHVEFAIF